MKGWYILWGPASSLCPGRVEGTCREHRKVVRYSDKFLCNVEFYPLHQDRGTFYLSTVPRQEPSPISEWSLYRHCIPQSHRLPCLPNFNYQYQTCSTWYSSLRLSLRVPLRRDSLNPNLFLHPKTKRPSPLLLPLLLVLQHFLHRHSELRTEYQGCLLLSSPLSSTCHQFCSRWKPKKLLSRTTSLCGCTIGSSC